MKTLIAYHSKTGVTEKCARLLAEMIDSDTKLLDLSKDTISPVNEFDNVILGSFVHASRVSGKIKGFIKRFRKDIETKKFGIFLCMLGTEEDFRNYLKANFDQDLLRSCVATGYFGGEIHFEKLNFIVRALVKMIIARHGMPPAKVLQENIEAFAQKFKNN